MSDSQTLDVPSLKVVELREELAKRGLDTKGLKKDVCPCPVCAESRMNR
jgi:hypothetical protein